MQRHSKVEIKKDTVIKTASPELMRVEVEKTRRAHKIGKDCGLFRVPEVLDFDEDKGTAIFEKIKNIQPVFPKLINQVSIVQNTAMALAIIHKYLILPTEMVQHLPDELALSYSEVFLHGDYNGSNVSVDIKNNKLVILDWQMTARHGGRATYGTRYFDVIWFINYMLWLPTIKYLFSNPVNKVAQQFLTSYFHEAQNNYNAEQFDAYVNNFFAVKKESRKINANWRTRYLLPRCQKLTEKFLKSLTPQNY